MTVPALKTVEIVRGQALDILISVPDAADLTAATIEFGLAEKDYSAYVTTLSTSASGQIITVALEGAESAALPRERYYFSCWVTISGDPTPVARGYLLLHDDSRNR